MTAALTPALALAYLSELSADIRAAIVFDAGGEELAAIVFDAGREELASTRTAEARGGPQAVDAREAAFVAAARALLAEAPVVRALTVSGGAFGARDDRHGVVVATGPLALPSVVVHDLRSVLAALGGTPPHAGVSEASPAAAEALLNAL
jgi:hypothetical protein